MIQATPPLMTFEEFLNWYPEDGRPYELIQWGGSGGATPG
jgi:Uma2 family endonuclease